MLEGLPMTDPRVIVGYIDYFAEAGLLAYLLVAAFRRQASGLLGITAYMLASVGFGGLRMYSALRYGPFSHEYALCYWLTDYAVVFAIFLLIASFFRRVCAGRTEKWRRIRLMLVSAFALTGTVSYATILYRGRSFFPYFVVEFQQDLYFACLVLTTMLYLMVVRSASADDQLGLLVSGIGLAFAGFAASYALVIATRWAKLPDILFGYIPQISDIAMMSIWFYTAAHVTKRAQAREEECSAQEAVPARALTRTMIRP